MTNFLDNFNKIYYPPKEEVFIVRKSQVELLIQLAKGDTIKETAERMNRYLQNHDMN